MFKKPAFNQVTLAVNLDRAVTSLRVEIQADRDVGAALGKLVVDNSPEEVLPTWVVEGNDVWRAISIRDNNEQTY